MKFADLAVSAFLILFPLAWLASSAYATWKEYHRHIEQIKMIDNMRRSDGATNALLAKCLICMGESEVAHCLPRRRRHPASKGHRYGGTGRNQ